MPIIKGNWVMTDYINSLKVTKSPIKSWEVLKGIVEIWIGDEINEGRLEVGASYNNHEGYSFGIYFELGQNSKSLKIDLNTYEEDSSFYELGYEIAKADTFLYLYHYKKNKILIDKRQFLKVNLIKTIDKADAALEYKTNEILISGKYYLVDKTDSKIPVVFNSDGTVIGLPGIKTYYINTDFMVGPLNNLDELSFNIYQKNQKNYAIEIKSDAIYLYETKEDKDHINLLLGKLKYKLLKQ